MSKAAELIASLQSQAQFDSAGSFSLDREKAREKMRQFQLADPHRYVLLLVEAAVLRGATTLSFEIDSDDMRLCFDAGLTWEDLQELYASLFVDRSSVAIRARRELALGCNAVMALNPRWVRIESFSRGEDRELRAISALLRPDAEDEILQLDAPMNPPDMSPPWTTIHVKERFRPGLLVRFLHDIGGTIPEEKLIRERCALASTRVILDGVCVSHGLPVKELVGAVSFSTQHLRGTAGFDRLAWGSERSAMVVLSNGVEIATHDLSDSIPGLWFWVDGSDFRKDVSQADVVRNDPVYEATLAALGGARDQVLGRLVQTWTAGEYTDATVPTASAVFDLIRDCFMRWGDAQWLVPDSGPLSLVADMPIWRTVDRRWLSPRALMQEADPARGIMYTDRDFAGVMPQGWGPVIHVVGGAVESAAIQRVHPQATSATDGLQREVPWELNRRKWRARVHSIELPRGALRHPLFFEQGELRGCVALGPEQRGSIRVVVDGCLLTELEVGFIGVSAVITGPFQPVRDYTRPRHDRSFATALLLLLAQLPLLIQKWAEEGEVGDVVRRCVFAITQPGFAFDWLRSLGFAADAVKQLLDHLEQPSLMPELGLGGDPIKGPWPTAVARAISFVTVDQRRVTLAEIDRDRLTRTRAQGKVLIVDHSAPCSDLVNELLIHADANDRSLLLRVFGDDALHDDTKAYIRELSRRRFNAKPQRFAALPSTTWTTRIEPHGDKKVGMISGYVGIAAASVREWEPSSQRRVRIDVLTENRSLCMIEERSWLPGAQAVMNWERAPVNQEWDGLTGSTQPLLDAVEQGLIQIIVERVNVAKRERQRPPDDVRRLLWLALVSPFVSTEHARAWRALRRHHQGDHQAAVAAYFEVMMLFPGVPLPELREAIKLLLDDAKPPSAAAILSLSGHPHRIRPSAATREFHRQLLERYELLESVPMVSLASGKFMDLATLCEQFNRTGEIAYVEDRSLRWNGDDRVIVRADDIDHVALIRLFGREQLVEVSGWIHERRHQQRFEARARLEQIRVADSDRLVGVEIRRDDFVGELAIPRWHAAEGKNMSITLCCDRRVVQDLDVHAALPAIGIVDDPHAELSADYTSVNTTSARMAALRLMLSDVLSDQLLPALCERYPSLAEHERELARSWIFMYWRRNSPRAGDYPNRLSEAGQRFAKLGLFRDVDGSARSLEQLSLREQAEGCVWYVEHHPGHALAPSIPVVEARGPELVALADSFTKLEDFGARWQQQVTGAKRRHAAPDLPSAPITAPADALISAEFTRHGMEGAVWLPDRYPFEHAVSLGSEGKLVEVRQPVELLAAQGIVAGPLPVDDRFEHVQLSGAQQRYLDGRVISLYSELLNLRRRQLARPDKVEFSNPEVARRRAVGLDLLRAAVVNLAQARRRGDSFDAILGNLERRLIEEPLLRLATGALISVQVARELRPLELAHLDIWDPKQPEPEPEPELEPEPDPRVDEPYVFELSASDLEAIAEELGVQVESPPQEPAVEHQPVIEPDYVGELLERVRGELRLLRERHQIMLTEGLLDCVDAEPGNGRELVRIDDRVVFDSEHPRFVRALEDPDPIWVSFLASVAYTGLNRWLDDVTDAHELAFHAGHAQLLLSGELDVSPVA